MRTTTRRTRRPWTSYAVGAAVAAALLVTTACEEDNANGPRDRAPDPLGEPAVVLKDGKSVSFAVTYPVNDSGGSGVDVTGLVVTPPNETKSVTLDWPGTSLPVTDGSGTPVKVGPIGSAGQGG
ncbi:DUF4232 domain-containing protein [Streptomyces cellulosae]